MLVKAEDVSDDILEITGSFTGRSIGGELDAHSGHFILRLCSQFFPHRYKSDIAKTINKRNKNLDAPFAFKDDGHY